MLPRKFFHDVGSQQVEAHIEDSCEALLVANVNKVRKEVLRNFGGGGRSGRDDRIFVQLVLLRQGYRLFPS